MLEKSFLQNTDKFIYLFIVVIVVHFFRSRLETLKSNRRNNMPLLYKVLKYNNIKNLYTFLTSNNT